MTAAKAAAFDWLALPWVSPTWWTVHRRTVPQNMAALRQIVRNLLKKEASLKVAVQGKRLQADWRADYLPKVLLG